MLAAIGPYQPANKLENSVVVDRLRGEEGPQWIVMQPRWWLRLQFDADLGRQGGAMTPIAQGLVRLFRYSLVGGLGLALKFCVLTGLVKLAGVGYLSATACAVEAAILHNFVWHMHWTWGDRSQGLSWQQVLWWLAKFHLANGAVAMAVNLAVMRLLVGDLRLHYLPANVIATIAAGLAGFTISNFLVFVSRQPASCRT